MKKLLCVLLLAFSSVTTFAADVYPSIPKELYNATHRLSYRRQEGDETIVGNGTAVSVDLSEFGLVGSRFLITAAHCIQTKGKLHDPQIEINDPKYKKVWINAKVLAFDDKNDVAIIMVDQDMEKIFKLAAANPETGDALLTIGSPQGTGLTATLGFMSESLTENWYQGSMTIAHGNSGGPVFDPNNKLIVGIIVAALPDLDKSRQSLGGAANVALFAAVSQIRSFLTDNLDKIKKKAK